MLRRILPLLICALLPACGGSKGSASAPTSPTPTPTPVPATTRIINVSGDLTFGDVAVGNQRDLTFTISNSGNAVLTVSGMAVSGGLASHMLASWTNGQIGAGASQSVTVRFAPTAAGSFSGVLTVNGDQTSGTNTLPVSGNAIAGFAGTWGGSYIVQACDGTGSVQDLLCSSQRGVFPPGTSLPLSMVFTQSGNNVSGTVSFGQVTGPVTGVITPDGVLTLQGTATSGTLTAVISTWRTQVQGNSMVGDVSYNVTITGVPGVGVMVARLQGVTRR